MTAKLFRVTYIYKGQDGDFELRAYGSESALRLTKIVLEDRGYNLDKLRIIKTREITDES